MVSTWLIHHPIQGSFLITLGFQAASSIPFPLSLMRSMLSCVGRAVLLLSQGPLRLSLFCWFPCFHCPLPLPVQCPGITLCTPSFLHLYSHDLIQVYDLDVVTCWWLPNASIPQDFCYKLHNHAVNCPLHISAWMTIRSLKVNMWKKDGWSCLTKISPSVLVEVLSFQMLEPKSVHRNSCLSPTTVNQSFREPCWLLPSN